FKTGQYQSAIDTLQLLPRPDRDARAAIGEAQLAMRRTTEARRTFDALLANGSLDDASLRACAGLDRIDAATGNVLTAAEGLRRRLPIQPQLRRSAATLPDPGKQLSAAAPPRRGAVPDRSRLFS